MKKHLLTALILCFLLNAGLTSCKTEVREGDTKWNEAVAPFRKSLGMGGYKLSYLDMGSGEPVVMVHGFADSTYSWNKNAFALKDAGYRLILVDQPGHGLSDIPPAPYTFSVENQAKVVMTLTEMLGLKDFNLVGHCTGGSIALYLAEKYPDRIRRLAVLDPIAYKPPAVQLLRLPGAGFLAASVGGPFTVRMGLEDAFYNSDMVTETMVNEYSRPMNKPGYWNMLVSVEKEFYSPEFSFTAKGLPRIDRQTLIIWGKQDTWVTEDEGRKLSQDILNSSLHILEKCGHNPHQECSQSVNPLLVRFLRGTGKRAADPFLLTPGAGIGRLSLGLSREKVKELAGKPVSFTDNGDQFKGFIVRYRDDQVSELLVTSPSYHTLQGVSTKSTKQDFLASYPNAKCICYEAKSGGQAAQGLMCDALGQGIAYDWNSYEGKNRLETVTIIIHAPRTPARVYGTATDCQGREPAGQESPPE
jgi:pimeloyl-ACP methyl ester carboxylesterase